MYGLEKRLGKTWNLAKIFFHIEKQPLTQYIGCKQANNAFSKWSEQYTPWTIWQVPAHLLMEGDI